MLARRAYAIDSRAISTPQPGQRTGPARRLRDPRIAQMAALGAILVTGALRYDFAIRLAQVALTFAAGLLAQLGFDRLAGRPTRSLRSPLITSLSISTLLRADSLWAHPLTAVAAIGSKYLLCARGKHLFNPSCLGVIVALIAIPQVWISPGQWGAGIALAGWIVVAGSIAVARAARTDISVSFVLFYCAALAARVICYGQRAAVLFHQLSGGTLLLFAFFMLSDPKTTPDSRRGRIVHAAVVAAIGFVLGFRFYVNNALLWALFLATPAVVLWDALWPAAQFNWHTQGDDDGTFQAAHRPYRTGIVRGRDDRRVTRIGASVLRVLRWPG